MIRAVVMFYPGKGRRRFGHVDVTLEVAPNRWVRVAPTRTRLCVQAGASAPAGLERQARLVGAAAILWTTVDTGNDGRWWPWGPPTCVEVVKRVLGIRSWRVVTVGQLYRFLKEDRT